MALIVRLDGEMPPVVLPPYSLDGSATVAEVLQAACAFFRRPVEDSRLVVTDTGQVLDRMEQPVASFGVEHWEMLTLQSLAGRRYERVTFGAAGPEARPLP